MPHYKFAYPVYNAVMEDIDLSFHVADVTFVTKYSLSREFVYNDEGRRQFGDNQIFATVTVCGNDEYAKKLSYDMCCFATDIFKICSDLYHNNFFNPKKWQFDVESDFVTQGKSCYFYNNQDICTPEDIFANYHADRYKSIIDSKLLDSLTKWNIADFESLFRVFYSSDAKSIHKVLKRACHIYSQSFSINSIDERIVLLCTVLDTIATNEHYGKVQQLKCHLPDLVLKSKRLSEQLNKFIEDVYDARSAYIHNAEESDFEEKVVDKLEKMVYRVILQTIRNSTKYRSTKELCIAIEKGSFVPNLDSLPDIYIGTVSYNDEKK